PVMSWAVEKKDESSASAEVKQQIEEIKEAVASDTSTGSGNTELEVLDVSVKKETKESSGGGSTTTENITETSQVVEIIVSFNMNGRFGFSLYRHHDGKAEPFQSRSGRFAKGSFADGYFFADKAAGLFYIYTSRFSTYAIGYEEGTSYAVTVNSGTGGGDYAEGATVTITADAAPSGQVFDKWTTSDGVSFANANSATTTFTMPTKAVTVTATYRNTSSGGTPSSGGYSPSTTTITVPVSGDSASVSVSASVSGTTATVKAPTTAQLDKVIGESVKTGEVTIDVSRLSKNVATVSIPTETVKAIEKAVSDPDNDASALTVKLTDGSVTFDAKALAAITDQSKGGTIQLNLDGITESGLRTAQKTAIKDMDVQAIYDAYLTSNGQRISDFKGGKATVTVSYALKDGQIGRGVVVWYVADDGKTAEVPTAYNDKTVSFTVEHFSNYVIAYDAERAAACPQDSTCPISAFTDADPTAWYHDGVHYVLENGIMSGLGNGQFAPNDTTSRAMLAQILYNMEGKPAIRSGIPFEDVSESDWYAMAISWAESNGIIGGYGNGKFGPNDDLTREQLVTIMYRYAKDKGIDVSVGENTNILSYDDAFDVSEWAIPAMQWAVGNGLISGRTASTLNPKDKATRAEIATIIMRYCEEIAK
ncbi:MAG: S-layer homology domain-containing protein, partial [Oscillospiraceae bacterium]|nr:S-layer homology domain-containing protein [Oscillospiraceae bacterium]